MHKALEPLEWLIGKWHSTEAKAFFPTMTDVNYVEQIEFSQVGQPLLNYNASSRHAEKGNLMHLEKGFLRIQIDSNAVAFMVAHNFGVTELSEGQVVEKKISLTSTNVSRMSFSKDPAVTKIERTLELTDEDTLTSVVSMETEAQPLQEHLRVTYKRVKKE